MTRALALLLLSLVACTTAPPPRPADEQTRNAIRQLTELIARQSTNLPYIYVLATYHAQAGKPRAGLRSFEGATIWPMEKLEDPVMLRIAL